jgi:hypothetical protein
MWLRQVGVRKSGWEVKTMKTMKTMLGCLSMAALAVVLAAPVSAQIVALNASVPFDFIVGGRTMPAGDYVLATMDNHAILRVQNADTSIMPAFAVSNGADGSLDDSKAFLTFRRYGGDYFLAKIWDGSSAAGREIPMSRTEREKAKSASIGKPEIVMVLARR